MLRSLLALLALLISSSVFAQAPQAPTWPTKPVHLIVPYPGGGGIDVLGRVLGRRLQAEWGQPIVIENKPGASTIPATDAVAKAEPDGYTLLLTTDSSITINPHLFAKLPYDPLRDLAPVSLLVFLEQMLLAQPSLPANNVAELVALAKAKPGTLNYASYGSGSQPHLAGELLKASAGIDIVHIPYKGISLALTALLSGEVDLTFGGIASSRPLIQAGKIKALAIGGPKRSPLLPDVATFSEQGYPDVVTHVWFGLFAPAGTPRDIVQKVQRDVSRIMNEPAFREDEIIKKGYDLGATTPDEFAAYLRRDYAERARAVKISGAKTE